MLMVDEGRLPHALLLCGPMGCGKMALALAFASYLLGERQEDGSQLQSYNSQLTSNAEAMLKKWQHPDLHFSYPVIKPKGTSAEHKMVSDDFSKEWNGLLMQGPYFTMDQWLQLMRAENQQAVIYEAESDELNRKLSLKSSMGGYKVCIIWLPERMNLACANKLLKLIEEPPALTVFLMVCEEPERLLETIISRTQRVDVKKIDTAAIEQALTERRGIDAEMAHRLARVANGSWTKALESLNADSENRLFLDMFIMLMRLAYQRNVKELKRWSETVAGYGREKQRRMLTYFLRLIRENFMYNFHQNELCYMTQEEENFARNFARFINEANVIGISELMQRAIRDIGQNANPKIVFFVMALNIIVLLLQK
jgi:DNA polymerase-3 subunit delta'